MDNLELSPSKQAEILEWCKTDFRKYQGRRQALDTNVLTWIQQYSQISTEIRKDWEHDVVVPLTYSSVEVLKPRIIASIFNDNKYIRVEATRKEDIDDENKERDYLLHEFDNMDVSNTVKMAIGDALITPCGWVKVMLLKTQGGDTEIGVELIDYFDVWEDLFYHRKAKDYFVRMESSVNKIGALIKNKIYKYGDIEAVKNSNYPIDVVNLKLQQQALLLNSPQEIFDPKDTKSNALNKVEVLQRWCSFDIDDSGEDTPINVYIANRTELLGVERRDPKDGRDVYPIRINKSGKISVGRPIPLITDGSQREANFTRSKMEDALDRQVSGTIIARQTADVNWNNIFMGGGNVNFVDDINEDMKEMPFGGVPQSGFLTMNLLMNDVKMGVGADDMAYGVQGKGGVTNTATGINKATSEAATRYRSYVTDIVSDLEPLFENIAYKCHKYCNRKEFVRVYGNQGFEVVDNDHHQKSWNYAIRISNVDSPDKEFKRQVDMTMLNIAAAIPGINSIELFREMLQNADFRNVDKIMGVYAQDKSRAIGIINKLLDKYKDNPEKLKDREGMSKEIEDILNNPGVKGLINPTASSVINNPNENQQAGQKGNTKLMSSQKP